MIMTNFTWFYLAFDPNHVLLFRFFFSLLICFFTVIVIASIYQGRQELWEAQGQSWEMRPPASEGSRNFFDRAI